MNDNKIIKYAVQECRKAGELLTDSNLLQKIVCLQNWEIDQLFNGENP